MPWYRINGMTVHLNLGRRKTPPPQCHAPGEKDICRGIGAYTCDWDLGHGLECGMPLCEEHAHQVGRDKHYCPKHLAMAREVGDEKPGPQASLFEGRT